MSRAETHSADQSFVELLRRAGAVSVRLWNAIHQASARGKLPYSSVQDYLGAGEIGKSRMLRVDNLGRKSLAELELIIAETIGGRPYIAPVQDASESEQASLEFASAMDDDVRNLGLSHFLARQLVVSVRLANAVAAAVTSDTCPFDTIGDYLDHPRRQEELCKIPNLGRGSAKEFERLVLRSVRIDAPKIVVASTNTYGYVDVGGLVRGTLSLLSDRQREILVERLVAGKTLEVVAAGCGGVTRERVRQIEAKALRIISNKCALFLRDSARANCLRLGEAELFELSVEVFANLTTSTHEEAKLYLSLLKRLDGDESALGLSQGHAFIRSRFMPRQTWKVSLKSELLQQPLPLTLEKVLESITSVPAFYIRDYFSQKWGLESEDAGVSAANYGTTRMCIDVLRKAGGPLHCSDVQARIFSNFHVELEEHAINATLGRLKETVITGPGTYALYECLPFTSEEIKSIREVALQHLAAKGLFLSSKLLFDEAFASSDQDYSGVLNHYTVMGIVQDDERFVTKRGNMIGLATFDLSATYLPLQDEIRKLVQDHGPITLQEIAQRLSDTRRLCNDSGIRQVLSQSSDIIQIGPRTFDVLHRFFESREEYEKVVLAIRISLLEGKKTTFAIATDLDSLSFSRATPHLIESLLQSMEEVQSAGGVHHLTEMSDELAKYRDAAITALQDDHPRDKLLSSSAIGINRERLIELSSLDSRFLRIPVLSNSTPDVGELASIIRDFDF